MTTIPSEARYLATALDLTGDGQAVTVVRDGDEFIVRSKDDAAERLGTVESVNAGPHVCQFTWLLTAPGEPWERRRRGYIDRAEADDAGLTDREEVA